MAIKKTNIHICSECFGEFGPKDLFIGEVPNREYSTYYCGHCITKLEITKCDPYLKPRATRKKVEKIEVAKEAPVKTKKVKVKL